MSFLFDVFLVLLHTYTHTYAVAYTFHSIFGLKTKFSLFLLNFHNLKCPNFDAEFFTTFTLVLFSLQVKKNGTSRRSRTTTVLKRLWNFYSWYIVGSDHITCVAVWDVWWCLQTNQVFSLGSTFFSDSFVLVIKQKSQYKIV